MNEATAKALATAFINTKACGDAAEDTTTPYIFTYMQTWLNEDEPRCWWVSFLISNSDGSEYTQDPNEAIVLVDDQTGECQFHESL